MRYEDWPKRLSAYVDAALNKPFKWGEHDCMLFASGAVEIITGVDPLATVRGKYSTARQAKKILKEHGGMEKLLSEYQLKVPVPMAQRGDVCLVDSVHGEALGVCCGERIACATYTGLVMAPMRLAHAAWRIG